MIKKKFFSILCNHCCSIMDGWIPYPSTAIHAQMPYITKYAVCKHLKALKQDGLITSDIYVEQGEERPILVRGYTVTEKGKNTPEYRLAYETERRICKECFDFDIGELRLVDGKEVDLLWEK